MSRGETAVVVLLGTMAFAAILGATLSLRESGKKRDIIYPSDLDPTGIATVLHSFVSAFSRTAEWKKEDRPVLILFWIGVGCAIAASAIAYS